MIFASRSLVNRWPPRCHHQDSAIARLTLEERTQDKGQQRPQYGDWQALQTERVLHSGQMYSLIYVSILPHVPSTSVKLISVLSSDEVPFWLKISAKPPKT